MYIKVATTVAVLLFTGNVFGHGTATTRAKAPEGWEPRIKGTADVGGAWSDPEDWPVLGVHGTVLPTGDVFVWDATPDDFDVDFDGVPTTFHDQQRNQTRVTVWNPKTNEHKATYNPEGTGDLFCAGSVHLTDGRIIFAGGDSGVSGKNGPSSNSNIYDPWTNTWTATDNLAAARWYSSLVSMSNGEVLTLGGTYSPEPYSEILGFNKQWRGFDGDIDPDTVLSGDYAWMNVASDGSIVYTGPHNRVDSIYTDDAFVEDAWVNGGKRDANELEGELGSYRGYGSYAMYDKDRVLISGGGSSVKSAVVVDLKTKATRETTPMNFGRRQHNLTILADGSVLATGGNSTGTDLYDPTSGVLTPEIWSPITEQWEIMNDMATDRQYHSIALLLPDARVLLAGSGYCVPCFTYDHQQQNAEIFSPPYLFKGERPVIVDAPERANYRDVVSLSVQGGATEAHIIKMASVTHSQSQDQRLVKLDIVSQNDNTVELRFPENRYLAPPGHYMLFIVKDGVPSEAAIINVGTPLVESGDIMVNNARTDEWEYYEIQGNDAHTLTVNFNANQNAATLYVKNDTWPTNRMQSGFDSCTVISNDQRQCVISSSGDARWYVGVRGGADTEFGISFSIRAGEHAQQSDYVAAPTNLNIEMVDDGEFKLSWNAVDEAVRYEIFRDGRLTNQSDNNVFVARGLNAMRVYSFQVLAISANGSRSALTEAKEIRTSTQAYILDPTTLYNPVVPTIPVNVHMHKTIATKGLLMWDRSIDDIGVNGYYIYRNGVLWGERADAGVTIFDDTLQPGETYSYEVAAYDRDGNVSPKSTPYVTTGSLIVHDDNAAPAPNDSDFTPVTLPDNTNCTYYCDEPVDPVDPVDPVTPTDPTTPDTTPVKRSGGGRVDLLLIGILMVTGGFRKLLLSGKFGKRFK